MPNHASAILIGHLGKDPETRLTQGGSHVTNCNLGVSTGYGDKKQTTWWRVTCFGKTAEIAADYLKKGHAVLFEGEPFLEEYEDKDGNNRSSLKLNASRLSLMEPKPQQAASAPAPKSKAPQKHDTPFDDEIPF